MKATPGMEFVIDVGIVILAAFAGGLAARLLKLPVLLGYLVAGMLIGPNTPGVVANPNLTQAVANLGVVLLMFAVGVQLHLSELNAVKKTAFGAGSISILACILLGTLVAPLFGWAPLTGLFAGAALALSSTAVVMRLLEERGELGTGHGKAMLGILVVQDLSLVLMVAVLPSLAKGALEVQMILEALGRAAIFLVGSVLFALKVAPILLEKVARARSRELFLLAMVVLCLGMAVIADRLGLGIALGAFFAGLVVSKSSYAQEVFSQVRPLRDVFASIFFVSVGMLIDPRFVVQNFGQVLGFTALILLVKPLTVMIPMRQLRWSGRTIALTGIGLANMGEFSFVLASIGQSKGVVDQQVVSLVLSAAVASLVLAPFALQHSGVIYYRLNKVRWIEKFLHGSKDDPILTPKIELHPEVVILGGGRVGRYVSDALLATNVPHVVIDLDPENLDRFTAANVCTVFGDATSEAVLKKAHLSKAKMAVISLSDSELSIMAFEEVKRVASDIFVVMRARQGADIPRIRAMGVNAVIHGEFEAGAEVIRQTLRHLGIERDQVRKLLDEARLVHYRQEEAVTV